MKAKTLLRTGVCTVTAIIVLCSWTSAGTVSGRDSLPVQGIKQFQMEHYQEALSLFKRAAQEHPGPEMARWSGLTYYHLLQYDRALPFLKDAVSSGNDDIEVLHALTHIYLETQKITSAIETVERMLKSHGNLSVSDYTLAGRVYAAADHEDRAIEFFKKAITINPSSDAAVDMARLLMKQGNNSAARHLMETAILASPESFNAQRLKKIQQSLKETTKPYSIALGYRYEYDSNAILEPDDPEIASDFERKSDQRHVITADIMAHSLQWNGMQAFGEAHLSNNWYHHLSELDEFTQDYVLGMGWSSGNYGVRLPLEYTNVIVDGDSYLDQYAINPGAYYRLFSATIYGFMRFSHQDYHNEVLTPDENRDGDTELLGLMTLVPFYNNQGLLRLIAQGSRAFTAGRDWDRDQAMVYGNLSFDFFSWLGCNAGFQWDDLFFDYMQEVYLVKREDTALTLFAGMAVHPLKNWDFRVQYSYVDWDSNIPLYKYYRNVVSAGITWSY